MKFLKKYKNSLILKSNLIYNTNAKNNEKIKSLLLKEQKNFCAYTEKYITSIDSTEVEHFNSGIKFQDDYFNYYAVTRSANLKKKDEKYRNASFFNTLFFQDENECNERIIYSEDFLGWFYIGKDEEANQFIDFLGLNDPDLVEIRKKHIKRLKQLFEDANYNQNNILNYFRKYPEELSYISAIEKQLNIDLSEFVK